jgi:RNA polymerase sigma-70 factor (ECF subfamily)
VRDDASGSAKLLDAPIPQIRPRKNRPTFMSERELPPENPLPPAAEATDHLLVEGSRAGDQNAASQLYSRYVKRLTALVKRRCPAALARTVGVEDIVQSVFKTLFQRIGQGYYDVPDGHELWRLLLVIAMNRIRAKATYYHAVKRDGGQSDHEATARHRIVVQEITRESASDLVKLGLKEILEHLPVENRLIATLRIDGHTVAEVAKITGRSRRTVERILQETRLKLKHFLHEEG